MSHIRYLLEVIAEILLQKWLHFNTAVIDQISPRTWSLNKMGNIDDLKVFLAPRQVNQRLGEGYDVIWWLCQTLKVNWKGWETENDSLTHITNYYGTSSVY